MHSHVHGGIELKNSNIRSLAVDENCLDREEISDLWQSLFCGTKLSRDKGLLSGLQELIIVFWDQFGEEPSEEYMELRLSIIESDLREHSTLSVLPVVKAMDNKELATSSRWENPAKRELPEEGDSVYSWKRRSELF